MDAVTLNQLMQEGEPFQIALDATTDAEATFTLDTDTYDTVSGYFENRMLWVSGIRITPGSGETILALRFDEKLVWAGESADELLELSGVPYEVLATPIGADHSSVKEKYGVTFLPVRNKFSLQNIPGATNTSRVVIWGVSTPRTA